MKHIILTIFLSLSSITGHTQMITTIAGNGVPGYTGANIPATDAELTEPALLCTDKHGNIFIPDREASIIRKISPLGIITTIAGVPGGLNGYNGDGIPATSAQLNYPSAVAVDTMGNIYVSDELNNRIRKISTGGLITTIAGNGTYSFSGDDGPASASGIFRPCGIATDIAGNIYFADTYNDRVRKISTGGIITTVAGSTATTVGDGGPATAAQLQRPFGIALDGSGNLYISEFSGMRIRKVDAAGIITTIAGGAAGTSAADNIPATDASLYKPAGITIDQAGNLYLCLLDNIVRKISADGIITTIAGTGTAAFSGDGGAATSAALNTPLGVTTDADGNILIGDSFNSRVRRIQTSVSVNDTKKVPAELSIYPNPSSGIFIANISSCINERVHISVENISGKVIAAMDGTTNKPIEIHLSQINDGIYILKAATATTVLSHRLLLTE